MPSTQNVTLNSHVADRIQDLLQFREVTRNVREALEERAEQRSFCTQRHNYARSCHLCNFVLFENQYGSICLLGSQSSSCAIGSRHGLVQLAAKLLAKHTAAIREVG